MEQMIAAEYKVLMTVGLMAAARVIEGYSKLKRVIIGTLRRMIDEEDEVCSDDKAVNET